MENDSYAMMYADLEQGYLGGGPKVKALVAKFVQGSQPLQVTGTAANAKGREVRGPFMLFPNIQYHLVHSTTETASPILKQDIHHSFLSRQPKPA